MLFSINTGGQGWLAHPHYDREGNLYNFSVKQKPTSRYDVIKIPMRPESTETEPFRGIHVVTIYFYKYFFGYSVFIQNKITRSFYSLFDFIY